MREIKGEQGEIQSVLLVIGEAGGMGAWKLGGGRQAERMYKKRERNTGRGFEN